MERHSRDRAFQSLTEQRDWCYANKQHFCAAQKKPSRASESTKSIEKSEKQVL